MIHLTWSIINILIFVYFLYLVLGFVRKGKEIFNSKFRVVSIFILVIGIVQITTAAFIEKKPNRIIITEDYNKENDSKLEIVTLEENLTIDINMMIKYSIDEKEFIPIKSDSYLTGLVSGYTWEYISIEANCYKPGEKAVYTAVGKLNWNLFGITVYSQTKLFNGVIES